jgi:hypothetical protein
MRYRLQFGSVNTGKTVTFTYFRNADTEAAITAPAITERGDGEYSFEWDWTSTTATSISYLATFTDGPELYGVITSTSVATTSSAAGSAAGVNPWLWTAGQIINMAAVEIGLSETSDPYASTDAAFIQLRTLLKSAGHELMQSRAWQVLVRECTVTGDGTTDTFALPADFLRMKDQSGWNRTTRYPMQSVSAQQWQSLHAWAGTFSITTLFRMQQGRLVFYEAPASAADLRFEYVSRYWVASSGAAAADQYAPSAAGDTVMFEPLMVTRLLKAKYLQAKGFDSTGAFAEYAQAYESAAGLEPAPVLSLSGGHSGFRFIDGFNVPDTGFGS